ncbi:DUF3187 domain-containing protein [Sulfurimonas sp.]|uniref:DUF3187 domain-containing protein n=1 Tax=Sulfurimonas sp. TaxID=2022749 RepID=UPI00260FA696|nr:DUF3187 domain-containing protein [Sulfurimonas sp.]
MKCSLSLILLGLVSTSLLASVDSDMDGVDDTIDQCPNTPFTDLVNSVGCTKKSLISKHHFDVIVGASYADTNYITLTKTKTIASTFAVDYYYKNFSIQASTAYYAEQSETTNTTTNGLYDSYIGASYKLHPVKNLSLRLGAGALLPTYETSLNNNNTDYTAFTNAAYNINKLNLFVAYSYTMINDSDVSDATTTIQYQDTNALNVGVGYSFTSKFYLSSSYYTSTSIYKGVKDIQTASLYSFYQINKHRSVSLSYAYGLSDTASDNYVALRLGFYF